MKNVFSLLLTLALCAGLAVPAAADVYEDPTAAALDAIHRTLEAAGITDVSLASPFAPAVAWALQKGIAKGTAPSSFSPGNTCTVSHILTFLWRAAGRPGDAGNERAAVAAWAAGLGMDAPDLGAPCTRAAAVTYIWKAKGCPAAQKAASFSDVSASAPYAGAVSWAVEAGITKGTGGGAFSPESVCTRGQIVTFLYRALGGSVTAPAEPPKEQAPAAGTGTLANGKPITEENVLAIIEEMKLQYPSGMVWNSASTRTGVPSAAANKLEGLYWSSNMGGCGGFASLVSDTIFGAGEANPIRKVPFTEMRPGDILIKCSPDGKCMHWTVAASRITGTEAYDFDDPSIGSSEDTPGGMNYLYLVTTYGGNENAHVRYGLNSLPATPQPAYPYYYEVWTRYPTDNTTPWTGSSSSGSTSSGSSGTGSASSGGVQSAPAGSGVPIWDTPCDFCGKISSSTVMNDAFTKHVCNACYQKDPQAVYAYLES